MTASYAKPSSIPIVAPMDLPIDLRGLYFPRWYSRRLMKFYFTTKIEWVYSAINIQTSTVVACYHAQTRAIRKAKRKARHCAICKKKGEGLRVHFGESLCSDCRAQILITEVNEFLEADEEEEMRLAAKRKIKASLDHPELYENDPIPDCIRTPAKERT